MRLGDVHHHHDNLIRYAQHPRPRVGHGVVTNNPRLLHISIHITATTWSKPNEGSIPCLVRLNLVIAGALVTQPKLASSSTVNLIPRPSEMEAVTMHVKPHC